MRNDGYVDDEFSYQNVGFFQLCIFFLLDAIEAAKYMTNPQIAIINP